MSRQFYHINIVTKLFIDLNYHPVPIGPNPKSFLPYSPKTNGRRKSMTREEDSHFFFFIAFLCRLQNITMGGMTT